MQSLRAPTTLRGSPAPFLSARAFQCRSPRSHPPARTHRPTRTAASCASFATSTRMGTAAWEWCVRRQKTCARRTWRTRVRLSAPLSSCSCFHLSRTHSRALNTHIHAHTHAVGTGGLHPSRQPGHAVHARPDGRRAGGGACVVLFCMGVGNRGRLFLPAASSLYSRTKTNKHAAPARLCGTLPPRPDRGRPGSSVRGGSGRPGGRLGDAGAA